MYTHNEVSGNHPSDAAASASESWMKKKTPRATKVTVIVATEISRRSFRPALSTMTEAVKVAAKCTAPTMIVDTSELIPVLAACGGFKLEQIAIIS